MGGYALIDRAMVKWRGLLVYAGLELAMRITSDFIFAYAPSLGYRWFSIAIEASTTFYCFWQEYLLLFKDRDGDEGWPSIWS